MAASCGAETARDRLCRANLNLRQLYWFNRIAGLDALDHLAGEFVFVPGEKPLTTETLVDLTTGDAIQQIGPVPPDTAYGRLEALEPYIRQHADEAYQGEAGDSGAGTILRSTPQQEGILTGEP